MYRKVTEHFWWDEFRPNNEEKGWTPEGYQKFLLKLLCEEVETVRVRMPPNSWIKVTDGVRTVEDYVSLKARGYHPSPTSDHFFGKVIAGKAGSLFEESYPFSCGAMDIQAGGKMSTRELFGLFKRYFQLGQLNLGQIIYEEKKGVAWIHVGNNLEHVMKKLAAEGHISNYATDFLQSLDGGKSYRRINVMRRS